MVNFFIPDLQQIELLQQADPDRDWRLFGTGVQVWIGQTYLQLKKRGYPVTLTSEVPSSGVVVSHADHVTTLIAHRKLLSDLTIVSTRADRKPHPYADFEVVQNVHSAVSHHEFYIQHWPQPGLIPRDAQRGTRIENVAFKGSMQEMAPAFSAPEWSSTLQQHDMNWTCDTAAWEGNAASYETKWNDYAETDVIIALRKNPLHAYSNKPASKLINAWLAGVPAILGPEQAYRELRQSLLDYIEVTSSEEAAAALIKMKSEPQLYEAMVENGRRRANEVMADECAKAWAKLLFEIIPLRRPPKLVALAKSSYKSSRLRLANLANRQKQTSQSA